jgi:8-oxo-dGTP pyrophosphatase MutT (NUDIX family)
VKKIEERSSVGIVCFNKENPNMVLVVKHGQAASQPAGIYGLPSGHVEKGEELIEAAKRELEEETGLKALEMVPLDHDFGLTKLTIKTGTFLFYWDVFVCKDYTGQLRATGETEPEWVDINKVKDLWKLPNIMDAIEFAKKVL